MDVGGSALRGNAEAGEGVTGRISSEDEQQQYNAWYLAKFRPEKKEILVNVELIKMWQNELRHANDTGIHGPAC